MSHTNNPSAETDSCVESEQQLEDEMRARLEAYAEAKGLRLNPDEEMVSRVIRGLVKRQQKFGKPYCPCRVVTGDPEKDDKCVCPCDYHMEEIARDGICYCRLFTSKDYKPE